MKFGGTSVEDSSAIDRLVGIVRERLAEQPVVVASAMAKVTDQLIATSKVGERTFASYAAADSAIYLRTEGHLYRLQIK